MSDKHNDNNYIIEIDHLAVGLTRSPIFMGVNLRLFFSNVMICTLICIYAHTWWGIPLFVALHILMVKLSIKEPNFLIIWVTVLNKTPSVLNNRFWGKVNSYEPW